MTPLDLNQLPITIPIGEEGDQDYKLAHDPSFFSCPNFFASGGAYDHGADCAQQLHQETKGHSLMANEGDTTNTKIKLTWYKRYAQEEASQGGSNKWIMKKTRNSGQLGAETRGNMIKESDDIQGQNQTKSSTAGLIRVCSDCNTTRTPLWRGGPRGPKSLCNACGIRQRKARRSAEAAAAAAAINGAAPPKIRKEKKSGVLRAAAPFKKRCEMIAGGGATGGAPLKQLRFDDVKISLSGAASLGLVHERFPQDEREAAILLMALSCGLVRSRDRLLLASN